MKTNLLQTDVLEIIYDNACTGSKLRRFVIHAIATRFNKSANVQDSPSRWHKESLMDLAPFPLPRPEFMGAEKFSKIDICEWHVHGEGVKCGEGRDAQKVEENS